MGGRVNSPPIWEVIMRPRKFTYTLNALDADGFFNDVTGDISETPWTTVNAAITDGCAHQVTLTSASDLSGITLTFTGTDAEGRRQTEAALGPAATTTNLTKYFKTITSVLSSGTLGAATLDVGWTALARTPAIPISRFNVEASVGVKVGGTVSYSIQVTNDNVYANQDASWFNLTTAGGDDFYGYADPSSTAVRLDIASHTSGVLTFTVAQG